MALFLEDLWNSVFTPGPTPTLVAATNASFAALQFLLLALLVATYSIHFAVLSILCGGLWFSINWFIRELQASKAQAERTQEQSLPERNKPPPGDSDTETEAMPPPRRPAALKDPSTLLRPKPAEATAAIRKRPSMGDSSGYVSTDSEWDKISEAGDKDR